MRIPLAEYTKSQKQELLYGTNEFEGILPNLERRYKETQSDFIRTEIERYMRRETCPICNGLRLKPGSLSVTINGQSIADVTRLSVSLSLSYVSNLSSLNNREKPSVLPFLKR